MEYTITKAVFGTRPRVDALPSREVLEHLGEERMRKLISDHYDYLIESDIKDLFPPTEKGIEMAKKHAADFFIQICGGPRYFDESRGAPMMAARHSPFRITQSARIIWLETFAKAIENTDLNEELKESFWKYLDIFSIWMLNTNEEADTPKFRV